MFNHRHLISLEKFPKKDIQQMNIIRQWNYDSTIIDLTINDLNVSSEQLISLGYVGKDLGQLQKELLNLVRRGTLDNNERKLLDYSNQLKNKR